jgi:hypothetical protein
MILLAGSSCDEQGWPKQEARGKPHFFDQMTRCVTVQTLDAMRNGADTRCRLHLPTNTRGALGELGH